MASFPSWSTAVNRALTSSSLRSSHEINRNSKAILYGSCSNSVVSNFGSTCFASKRQCPASSPINFMASLSSLTSILQNDNQPEKPTSSPLTKHKKDGHPAMFMLAVIVCHSHSIVSLRVALSILIGIEEFVCFLHLPICP